MWSEFRKKSRAGFDINLYRNTQKKKIGGVCAGLADHFEIDPNIMRILLVAGLIFTGAVAFWAYIGAWVALSPRPIAEEAATRYEYDEGERRYRRKKIFRYQRSSSERLRDADERLSTLVRRVESMERYVTSRRFDLDKAFADLHKGGRS